MSHMIIDEQRASMVAAVFTTENAAEKALASLMQEGSFKDCDIRLVKPGDKTFDEKVEPEDAAIGRTLLKSHFVIGTAGLVIGITVAALLTIMGPPLFQSSPMLTFVALTLIALFLSLLVAGALSLRPDHDRVTNTIRHATKRGQWSLVVHAKKASKARHAKSLMKNFACSTVSSA